MKHDQDVNVLPTEDELDQLEGFLLSACVPEGGLNLEGVDGLMCATAIGPEIIRPSEWLPLVFGESAFQSEDQANLIVGILFRRWNEILQKVQINPESGSGFYTPLVNLGAEEQASEDLDSPCGWTWADGFIKGMSLRMESWERFFDQGEISNAITPIMLLHAGTVREVVDEEITHERRKQMVFMIPRCTHLLWDYWHRQSEGTPSPSEPRRNSEKIGRNDPCICGSGKKYKKCCLH